MRDIEVTKREILVGVIIVLVMIGLGFMISTSIHNNTIENNEKYFKALKVNNDPELFNYAIDTEVGNLVSYGTVKANEPVSDSMIDGEYFSITKIEEHYVMKTREVTYTDSNGNTKTKTETYWEWDEYDREYSNTKTFNYLGKSFKYNFIKFNNDRYIDTIQEGLFSKVRFVFYAIPKEFEGSLYSKVMNKTIEDNVFHYNMTIDELMEYKEKEAGTFVVLFWIGWILLTGAAVFGFIALENRYINGGR